MVRDGSWVFLGSQSMREMELDERREVGLIFRDSRVARRIRDTFEADWKASEHALEQPAEEEVPTERIARRVAKAISKELPDVGPLMDGAVQELAGELDEVHLLAEDVQQIVRGAVKEAVKEVVKDALEEAVEKTRGAASEVA
jgi:hypothetical protein